MKTLFISLLAIISLVGLETNQDQITIKATFDEYEDETFYFTYEEETSYEFQEIDPVASNKYDLKDDKFKGKKFEVTYSVKTDLDENDDEYTIYTILDLKQVN